MLNKDQIFTLLGDVEAIYCDDIKCVDWRGPDNLGIDPEDAQPNDILLELFIENDVEDAPDCSFELRDLLGAEISADGKSLLVSLEDNPPMIALRFCTEATIPLAPAALVKTKHVDLVTVTDPDTGLPCELEIRKLETGGLVGLDVAYLSQLDGDPWTDFPTNPYDASEGLLIPDDEGGDHKESAAPLHLPPGLVLRRSLPISKHLANYLGELPRPNSWNQFYYASLDAEDSDQWHGGWADLLTTAFWCCGKGCRLLVVPMRSSDGLMHEIEMTADSMRS